MRLRTFPRLMKRSIRERKKQGGKLEEREIIDAVATGGIVGSLRGAVIARLRNVAVGNNVQRVFDVGLI
ncbi:unnamed protein product [Pleuronectes platessa]|uniref:Uncharacterized protein n=1 Tax=Pleuronectes platessa TaxID=8262 RepID=A0A9N7VJX8_PLEPL|nr:unnamed protein product [Pleuronectes platessa]